jgi:hypothetical protein
VLDLPRASTGYIWRWCPSAGCRCAGLCGLQGRSARERGTGRSPGARERRAADVAVVQRGAVQYPTCTRNEHGTKTEKLHLDWPTYLTESKSQAECQVKLFTCCWRAAGQIDNLAEVLQNIGWFEFESRMIALASTGMWSCGLVEEGGGIKRDNDVSCTSARQNQNSQFSRSLTGCKTSLASYHYQLAILWFIHPVSCSSGTQKPNSTGSLSLSHGSSQH